MAGRWWSACMGGCLAGATAKPGPGAALSAEERQAEEGRSRDINKQDRSPSSNNAVQQHSAMEVGQKATIVHHSLQKLDTACNCDIPSPSKTISALEAEATQPGLSSPSPPLTSAENNQAPCGSFGDQGAHTSTEAAAPVAFSCTPCDTATPATQSSHAAELRAPPARDSVDGCSERPEVASAPANIMQASCPDLSPGVQEAAAASSTGDQAAQDLVQYVQADVQGAAAPDVAGPVNPQQTAAPPGATASSTLSLAGVAASPPLSILRHRTPSGRSFSAPSNPLGLSPLGSQQLPPHQQLQGALSRGAPDSSDVSPHPEATPIRRQGTSTSDPQAFGFSAPLSPCRAVSAAGPSGHAHIHSPSAPDFFTAASKLMRWASEFEDGGKSEGAGVGAASLLWTSRTCRAAGTPGGNSSLSGHLSSRMSSKLSSKLSGRPSGSLTASSMASRGSSREMPEPQLVSAGSGSGSGALSLAQLGLAKHPHPHPRGARPAPSSHHGDWGGLDPGSQPLAMVPENTLHGAGAEPLPPVTLPLSSHFSGAALEAPVRSSTSGSQLLLHCSSPRVHACSCGQCSACAAAALAADGAAPSSQRGSGSGTLHQIPSVPCGHQLGPPRAQGYVGVVTSPTLSRWGLMLSKAAEQQQQQPLPLRRVSREAFVRSHSHVPAAAAAAAERQVPVAPDAPAQAAAARRISVEEQRVQRSLSHSHQ